jgi:hypothetical protein
MGKKLDFSIIPFAHKIPYIKVKFYEQPMLSHEKDGESFSLYKIDGKEGLWIPATFRLIQGEHSDHIGTEQILAKIDNQNAGDFRQWKRANELTDFFKGV